MTPGEVEAMLENLDARAHRIEDILPMLATKQDLLATKQDLLAMQQELKAQMLALHEDVKSDIRLLAEHLARVLERLDARH